MPHPRSVLPIIVDDALASASIAVPPSLSRAKSILERAVTLAELMDADALKDVCSGFVELHKIGIKIFDNDGTRLVDIRVGSIDWCGYIFQNPTGRTRCTKLVSRIKQFAYPELADGVAVEQACFSGLKYVILPITYGGDVLGRVIYGPFLPENLQAPASEVYEFGDGFDPTHLWTFSRHLRRASDELVSKIINNFRRVIETLVFIAMKALMTQQMHVEAITANYNEISATNRMLRESLEKLRELDRLKSNFLAMISHELRTPLTSVIGYSEMLLEGMAGEMSTEQQEYVGTIKEKGESLLELIGSILDMSKIEAGMLRLNVSDIDLKEVIDAAATYVVPQIQKKQIRLSIQTQSVFPKIAGDREKIRQSIINLLGNAVKFTPSGGAIRVEAAVWEGVRKNPKELGRFGPAEEKFLRIDVADTGIGIAEEKLSQIFDSFYQVDNSITREYGGTGLGLSIVKRFVEAHGGEVWVESKEGVGTRFSLLLPMSAPGGAPVEL